MVFLLIQATTDIATSTSLQTNHFRLVSRFLFSTHSTGSYYHQCSKTSLIKHSLYNLPVVVNISFGVWVKNPYIKKCHLTCLPKTFAQISNWASFPVNADKWIVSLVSCCNLNSTEVCLHTSFNRLAVIFQIWFWLIEIKLPFLHGRECCRSHLAQYS